MSKCVVLEQSHSRTYSYRHNKPQKHYHCDIRMIIIQTLTTIWTSLLKVLSESGSKRQIKKQCRSSAAPQRSQHMENPAQKVNNQYLHS